MSAIRHHPLDSPGTPARRTPLTLIEPGDDAIEGLGIEEAITMADQHATGPGQ